MRTNWLLFLGVGAGLAAALAGVALVGTSIDRSPLAKLEAPLATARDVAYGPEPHHTLDLAYEPARPRPAIVMIHPGGWMQGDKAVYHGLMAEYARTGYATASVNFRPSNVAKFPAAVDDVRRALRWLRAHATSYGIDPARIGVIGWSSGAHLAMMLALDGEERVQAAAGYAGVYDFLMERQGRFPNDEGDPAVRAFLGCIPREDVELARRASPLAYLTPDDPPLLLLHGELDRRIDAEQTRHFASKLGAIGRKDEVILLPAEGHGRDVLPADAGARKRVRSFFATHLRPGE